MMEMLPTFHVISFSNDLELLSNSASNRVENMTDRYQWSDARYIRRSQRMSCLRVTRHSVGFAGYFNRKFDVRYKNPCTYVQTMSTLVECYDSPCLSKTQCGNHTQLCQAMPGPADYLSDTWICATLCYRFCSSAYTHRTSHVTHPSECDTANTPAIC